MSRPVTRLLFREDSYLLSFRGRIVDVRPADHPYLFVALDRTAFFPEGGGQPWDTGWIRIDPSIDPSDDPDVRFGVDQVLEGPGGPWHRLALPPGSGVAAREAWARPESLPGRQILGQVDPVRRTDHVQHHGGQHLLSEVLWKTRGIATLAFHLGDGDAAIEVSADRLSREELDALEDEVNDRIRRGGPVRTFVTDLQTARGLPLRRPPPPEDPVRIVEIVGLGMAACCGTHPDDLSRIGLLRITEAERIRGRLRLHFLCGRRAFLAARSDLQAAGEAAARMSGPVARLPALVDGLRSQVRTREAEAAEVLAELARLRIGQALAAIGEAEGPRILSLPLEDIRRMDLYGDTAMAMAAGTDLAAVVLAAEDRDGIRFQVRRTGPAAGGPDLRGLMKELAAVRPIRGGGSPDRVQGIHVLEGMSAGALADLLRQACARFIGRWGPGSASGA